MPIRSLHLPWYVLIVVRDYNHFMVVIFGRVSQLYYNIALDGTMVMIDVH